MVGAVGVAEALGDVGRDAADRLRRGGGARSSKTQTQKPYRRGSKMMQRFVGNCPHPRTTCYGNQGTASAHSI
ncbi:hypothetical protein AB0M68_31775 [Streptomyces sp. NPDC051453]|uniref:hypothetical protein n=1 Tax=Streptomyces sp. NPDC051453 TaxID=3154941 RepID=UPI003419BE0E